MMLKKQRTYGLNDISIVIPTYNRAKDVKETLISLQPFIKELGEIIVVDQSKDNQTKEIVKKFENKKVKYLFSKTPSITIARNLGVKNSSKNSRLICFIDDDVTLGRNYFSEILKIFNSNPQSKAVAAFFHIENLGFFGKMENFLKKLFFIRYYENNARIISAYGNTYPNNLKNTIKAQWLPGVNMVYKKEVFNEQKFDENLLGYTVAEDIDFSYRLSKRYPNSIFITPFAKITHRASMVERYPTEKMAYINQIDHFYFNYKNLNKNFAQKIIFIWSLLGISFLRTLNMTIKPTKINYLKWKYFFNSLYYCIKNTDNIKNPKKIKEQR